MLTHQHCFAGTTAMYDTSLIAQFIAKNSLLLKIAFVGPHLTLVVDYLASYAHKTGTSYIVLHYSPSILARRHSLVPVMVPLCEDPLLQHDRSNPSCFFNVNRLAKVVWMPLQKDAPKLYQFIHHFNFLYEEYNEILDLYSSEILNKPSVNSDIYREVACNWLKSDGNSWLQQKKDLMKLQEKPKLYIGGIFPLSGTKYIAPVLADGQSMAIGCFDCPHFSFLSCPDGSEGCEQQPSHSPRLSPGPDRV